MALAKWIERLHSPFSATGYAVSRPSPSVELASPDSTNPRLSLIGHMVDDRFVTDLHFVDGDTKTMLLRSVEGDAKAIWPPSAPLQELVEQENDAGPFLAGVGRSGKSHWSVIVCPLADEAGFEFDFACRVKTEPEWIGSRYKVLDDAALKLSPCDGCSFKQNADIAVFSADLLPEEPFPKTIRWKYRLSLRNAGE